MGGESPAFDRHAGIRSVTNQPEVNRSSDVLQMHLITKDDAEKCEW